MDNKRRTREINPPSPDQPWPVKHRRRIEKLKEEKLAEFARGCYDNFDWLEDYYQGCVYTAQRNRELRMRMETDPGAEAELEAEEEAKENARSRTEVNEQGIDDPLEFRRMDNLLMETPDNLDRNSLEMNGLSHLGRKDVDRSSLDTVILDRSDLDMSVTDESFFNISKDSSFHSVRPELILLHSSRQRGPGTIEADSDRMLTKSLFSSSKSHGSRTSAAIDTSDFGTGHTLLDSPSTTQYEKRHQRAGYRDEHLSKSSITSKVARVASDESSLPLSESTIQRRVATGFPNHVHDTDRNSIVQATTTATTSSTTTTTTTVSALYSGGKPTSLSAVSPQLLRLLRPSSGKDLILEDKDIVESQIERTSMDKLMAWRSPPGDTQSRTSQETSSRTSQDTLSRTSQDSSSRTSQDTLFSHTSQGTHPSRTLQEIVNSESTSRDLRKATDTGVFQREDRPIATTIDDNRNERGATPRSGTNSDESTYLKRSTEHVTPRPGTDSSESVHTKSSTEHSERPNRTLKLSGSTEPQIPDSDSIGTRNKDFYLSLAITTAESKSVPNTDVSHLKSRVATVLPEKRIIGQRKAGVQTLATQQPQPQQPQTQPQLQGLSSRLQKLGSTLVTQEGSSSTQSQASASYIVNRTAKTEVSSSSKNALSSSTQPVAKPSTSTLTSSILRHGVPRAPLPSTRVAENSLARTENQSSARNPFMASKSVFSGKKTTRAVLPDSTLTARSHLLAGIAKSGAPGSPKKDGKRETKSVDSKQHSQQPKQREPTTDTSTTTANTGSTTGAQSKATASNSIVTTTNPAPPPASSSGTTPFAANGTKVESNDRESSSSTTAVVERLSADQSSNPFLIPAPVHPQPQQPALPEWAQNQSKRRSNHEKTILPSIGDEDRDEEDDRSDIPDWAKRDALARTMEMQNHMNPEDIFGPLPTLVMTEVFPNYNARRSSRPRTSSSFREHYQNKTG